MSAGPGPEDCGCERGDHVAALVARALRPAPAAGLFEAPRAPEAVSARLRWRRLWELPVKHHCILVGAAFDTRELRGLFRLVGAERWRELSAYELHSTAVHFAKSRNEFSRLAQKRLAERYRAATSAFARTGGADTLVARWREWSSGGEAAAAYWAAITHPDCDELADEEIAREMHMLAHDLFAERRALARRSHALEEEATSLKAALATAQDRLGASQQDNARLRAEASAQAAQARDAREALERWQCGDRQAALQQRTQDLESALADARREGGALRRMLERLRAREGTGESAAAAAPATPPTPAEPCATIPLVSLNGRVLCVGGRSSLVPLYRATTETARAQFVHHDGGIEHHLSRLPALLGSADAVVCLAGDCSHGAYYAVKRYCKRFGKPCALVKNSSVYAFARGLATLAGRVGDAGAA